MGKFKDVREFQKVLVTPEFESIYIPYLEGTQKQVKWAEDIRQLYVDILQRKLDAIPIFQKADRLDLIEKFNNYINSNVCKEATHWINHHCSKCGSILASQKGLSRCSNGYCSYVKFDANYQGDV